jgi:hypothetical protein
MDGANRSTAEDAMQDIELAQRKRFIDSLELPPAEGVAMLPRRRGGDPGLRADANGAFVNGGSVMSFVAGVSPAHREMALQSALLAQLSASKLHDREREVEAWYRQYRKVLEHCGWVVQDFSFQRWDASGSTFTVEAAILNVLGAIATQNAMLIVQQTLAALKALAEGDGRFKVWDRASRSQSAGNFQVATATEEGGALAMNLAAFRFNAKRTDTKFLWFGYGTTDAELYTAAQAVTLDERIYAGVAPQVSSKLAERTGAFIADLEI